MKIGKYTVKYVFKPARIICDVMSLAMAVFAFVSAMSFAEIHPEIQIYEARTDLIMLWVFPSASAAVMLIYVVLTLKIPRFEKYNITKDNAQSVFDWYVFAVSLCKLPLLLSANEGLFIYQERLLGLEKSFFSVTFVLCALMVVIIIRFSMHRITSLTKTDNTKSKSVFIRSDILDDDKKEKK